MKVINGIGVSAGISIGKAKVIRKKSIRLSGVLLNNEAEMSSQLALFELAISRAVAEVTAIAQQKQNKLTDEETAILETQIELLKDPQLLEDVTALINDERKNAADALITVIETLVGVFMEMEDEYMRARSADVKDAGGRILKYLINQNQVVVSITEPDTIVVAEDLAPSDTITLDLTYITGFVTSAGSKASHTAIIARTKGIPAAAGCKDILEFVEDDDLIVVNGENGQVYINPTEEIIEDYRQKREQFIHHNEKLKSLKNKAAVTTDGTSVKLLGNISKADDLEDVFHNGGEGSGLLRTELLFMDRADFPSENEQFEFYKQAALKAKGKPIVVRTLDIGGDKQLPYFDLPAEQNPFLGYRAIRICLDRTDIFITQIRAILRASVFGDLRIMFPMIANVQELRQAKAILEDVKANLTKNNIRYNKGIKTGIMIEVPSAAVTADILAKEVDFFSIGTNDLCQYTLAVDRMSEKIAHLYDPFDPGVLRLIRYVIEQAGKHQIHVGMCGELAGDPSATLLLLGMGLRDFSMSAPAIPEVKSIIIDSSIQAAGEVCKKVLEMDNSQSIKAYLQQLPK